MEWVVLFNIQTLYFALMDKQKLKPFLMRLHPDTRSLLDKASEDQRRSVSSIIDQSVRDQLQPRYGELTPRLQRFLSGAKQ